MTAGAGWTEIFSAAAAAFAGFSSFMIWQAQREANIREVRPDLVLEHWSSTKTGERQLLNLGTIQNIGRGPAHQVVIDISESLDDSKDAIMLGKEEVLQEGMIYPFEASPEVTFDTSETAIPIVPLKSRVIWINYFDIKGNRYETYYYFIVHDMKSKKPIPQNPPSVLLVKRGTRFRSAWRIRFADAFWRKSAPIRRLWNKDAEPYQF